MTHLLTINIVDMHVWLFLIVIYNTMTYLLTVSIVNMHELINNTFILYTRLNFNFQLHGHLNITIHEIQVSLNLVPKIISVLIPLPNPPILLLVEDCKVLPLNLT